MAAAAKRAEPNASVPGNRDFIVFSAFMPSMKVPDAPTNQSPPDDSNLQEMTTGASA
jgi:hypothetical protein